MIGVISSFGSEIARDHQFTTEKEQVILKRARKHCATPFHVKAYLGTTNIYLICRYPVTVVDE
ncbi:hypothetical protein HOLleu_32766 [Holothuria leucospilota]|uniref:Uncharacterized protein n=1 Tax=Holothuria leucospilota TaxID=206669 RepID=A0A9Q1GZC3_HOLLE|nr:hypothetical protein HOLleu_32766 [Holothuria leucospilota]